MAMPPSPLTGSEEAFDAYHRWLSIPPAEQPPNHYRLLGTGLFEDDAEVIAGAADRQMAHIRSFQAGKHSALSQRILNEIATARICLLTPAKKAAYDETLRASLAAAAPTAAPPAPGPEIPLDLGFDVESVSGERRPAAVPSPGSSAVHAAGRKQKSWLPMAVGGGLVLIGLLIVLIVAVVSRPHQVPRKPQLAPIADQQVEQGKPLTVALPLADMGSPSRTLVMDLADDAPPMAAINVTATVPPAGIFTWTPQKAGQFSIGVQVTAKGSKDVLDQKTFTVTVLAPRSPAAPPTSPAPPVSPAPPATAAVGPVIVPIEPRPPIQANSEFEFAVGANGGKNPHTFTLLGDLHGAQIDPRTGIFAWRPTAEQAGGTYTFTVCATDSSPAHRSDTKTFTVSVLAAPAPLRPAIIPIAPRLVEANRRIALTITAHGSTSPLTYTILGDTHGAEIDPQTGVFSWSPTVAQAGQTYEFTVSAAESGLEHRSSKYTFTVRVLTPVVQRPKLAVAATAAELTNALADKAYVIWAQLAKSDLPDSSIEKLKAWTEQGGVVWLDTDLGREFGFRLIHREMPGAKASAVAMDERHDILKWMSPLNNSAQVRTSKVTHPRQSVIEFPMPAGGLMVAGKLSDIRDHGTTTPLFLYFDRKIPPKPPTEHQSCWVCCAVRKCGNGFAVYRPRAVTSDNTGTAFEANLRAWSYNVTGAAQTMEQPAAGARFAAIAYSMSTDRVGYVNNQLDATSETRIAIGRCNATDAFLVVCGSKWCALARGDTIQAFGGGSGDTATEAQDAARTECLRRAPGTCRIILCAPAYTPTYTQPVNQ